MQGNDEINIVCTKGKINGFITNLWKKNIYNIYLWIIVVCVTSRNVLFRFAHLLRWRWDKCRHMLWSLVQDSQNVQNNYWINIVEDTLCSYLESALHVSLYASISARKREDGCNFKKSAKFKLNKLFICIKAAFFKYVLPLLKKNKSKTIFQAVLVLFNEFIIYKLCELRVTQ